MIGDAADELRVAHRAAALLTKLLIHGSGATSLLRRRRIRSCMLVQDERSMHGMRGGSNDHSSSCTNPH